MATQILLKLNQFFSSIQSTPSKEWFNVILTKMNEILLIIPHLFQSIFGKLAQIFSAENLAHWLAVAKPCLLVGLGVVLFCLFCWCLLPAIISCAVWIVVIIWSLIVGLFTLLWSLIRGFFGLLGKMCCCCCRGSARMMKAPGMGGKVLIPRAAFQANPGAYFMNLRAGKPLLG